jgi:nucleoside-diphosphate-sugar epimerase
LDDPLIVAPLLSGKVTALPDMGETVRVEFVYVENAAAAHVRALEKLLSADGAEASRLSGRAFNVTNGDLQAVSPFVLWSTLVDKARARQRELREPLPHLSPLRRLPYWPLFIGACLSELVFFILCGHVPYRRHTFWNLTRASLRLSATSVTQSLEATRLELGFHPRYDSLQALDHMLAQWQGQQLLGAHRQTVAEPRSP